MTDAFENTTYALPQAQRDYSLEELAQGAEDALAETVSFRQSVNYAGRDYGGKYINLQKETAEAEGLTLLETDLYGRGRIPYHTEVCLDTHNGELVRSFCTCTDFKENLYVCRHVASLVLAWLMKNDGPECLKGTAVEDALIRRTGISTPLVPGILKRTDPLLSALTRMEITGAKTETEAMQLEGKKTQMLSADLLLKPAGGTLAAELRVGGKKHYVIRSIGKLLDAYGTDAVYSFSNAVRLPAGRSRYEPSSQKVLDFLYQLYKENERQERLSTVFPGGNRDSRELWMRGRDLDVFMELLDGQTVQVEDEGASAASCRVELSGQPKAVGLSREEFGAMLHVPAQVVLGYGMGFLYTREGNRVLRLPSDQMELRKNLAGICRNGAEFYIQEKDLPAVCRNLLPLAAKDGQLEAEGLDLTLYMPEIPGFQIYLDYPQRDMISCQLYALYRKGEEKYDLFETKGAKVRNHAAETALRDRVSPFFTAFEESSHTLFLECDEERLYVFLTEVIPVLSGFGEVLISDQLKRLKVRRSGEMAVGIQVESGSLVVSLKSNMMSKHEIMEALSAYSRKKRYTRLKSGEFITIDPAESAIWEALSETYRSYGKKNPEAMKVPLFRALYLDEMLMDREAIILTEGTEYKALLRNLREEEHRNYQVPPSLAEVLRPYQKDGYRWIRMLKENGLGGILADDMGLGKTLQVLSFLLSEQENGKHGDDLRTLIISPASLVYNWKKEIETFTPQLRCRVIAGTAERRRELIRGAQQDADIFITSYDLLKRDISEYDGISFANEIIDEAQYIKNQNTQAAKGVRLVESSFRMALTGTPIENRLSELWSIFDYLMPGFLYSYSRFRTEYETPVIIDHDEAALQAIRSMVHPFILRRLKKDVLKDLPDKLEETVTVELEGEQRRIYDAYAERLKMYLDKQSEEEFHNSKLEILAELTRLRQVCCGPELFLQDYKGENAKKEACMELLHQAVDGGHKVLLFSQFTAVLDELCAQIAKEGMKYHRIDGSVSKEQRMQQVDSFAKDDVPVFCISLKAGGTGLNLTAADIVIHYDPWWNVAAQNQATDRTHRIGQTNTVTVYQLIAEQTIEQQIVSLQQSKAQLAQDILSGEGISSILINKADLLKLL